MLSTSKSELHKLVNALPQQEAMIAKRFLEFLLTKADDPVLKAFLNAPEADEPLDEEDRKAIREAEQAISEGKVVSWEQLQEELLQ